MNKRKKKLIILVAFLIGCTAIVYTLYLSPLFFATSFVKESFGATYQNIEDVIYHQESIFDSKFKNYMGDDMYVDIQWMKENEASFELCSPVRSRIQQFDVMDPVIELEFDWMLKTKVDPTPPIEKSILQLNLKRNKLLNYKITFASNKFF